MMEARAAADDPSTAAVCLPAAVPFEEDERDPSIWFLDHSYIENMWAMSKKINGALEAAPLSTSHTIGARPPHASVLSSRQSG